MQTEKLASLRSKLIDELKKESIDYSAIAELNKKILEFDDSNFRFSVDAKHIHRLGFELVGRQDTALSELIKNAYDADATEVTIQFSDFESAGGTLVIADDGAGMSAQAVRDTWMRLSTSTKENLPVSELFGRSRAGRKGIGRFAVERLGKRLLLETCTYGSRSGIQVEFDWDELFKPDTDLGLLSFEVKTFEKPPETHGTKLTISPLRDRWTETQLNNVWKSVILLQPPFRLRPSSRSPNFTSKHTDPGFSVVINGKSAKDVQSEISLSKTFLEQRTARITGSIDSSGVAKFKVESEKLGVSEEAVSEKRFTVVGETILEADYFIFARELISGFSLPTAQEVGAKYGGIRVYRDGFRVLPYGEARNDWLRLAYDTGRRNLLMPASNNNFFGHVELTSRDNVLLEETASREGLIENEAFVELSDFVRTCVEWGALRIAAARERKQTGSQRGFTSKRRKKSPSDQVKEAFETVQLDLVGATAETPIVVAAQTLATVHAEVQKIVRSLEMDRDSHLRYEELLRILASLGTSIAVFSHEIRGALNGFAGSLLALRDLLERSSTMDEAAPLLDKVENRLKRLADLGSYVISLVAHTANREKVEVPIYSAISDFVTQFKNYLDSRQIHFDIDVTPRYLRSSPIHRSEIDSVLFNFLTNSVKAMDRANVDPRKIKISGARQGSDVRISFQDNGTGVDASIRDRIFDAFVTTQQYGDDDLAGPGSGLGLKIVADIASANGGRVELGTPDNGFSCRLDFFVPASKEQI